MKNDIPMSDQARKVALKLMDEGYDNYFLIRQPRALKHGITSQQATMVRRYWRETKVNTKYMGTVGINAVQASVLPKVIAAEVKRGLDSFTLSGPWVGEDGTLELHFHNKPEQDKLGVKVTIGVRGGVNRVEVPPITVPWRRPSAVGGRR